MNKLPSRFSPIRRFAVSPFLSSSPRPRVAASPRFSPSPFRPLALSPFLLLFLLPSCSDLKMGPPPSSYIGPLPGQPLTTAPSGPIEIPAKHPLPAPATRPVPTTQPLSLTVGDAIVTALENNPGLAVNRLDPAIRRTFEQQRRAAFDPALTGQVQAGKSDRAAGGGTTRRRDVIANTASAQASVQQFFPTGTTVAVDATADYNDFDFYSDTARLGLTVTQSLLRGAGADVNLAALREARIDTKLSQYELRGFAESLVAQVEETYWDYALSQRQIDIFTESLSLAGQQLDQTNELIRVGKLAETERAAAEAELATRREDLINARANLESTRLRLLRLLNPPGAAGADDGETSGNFWSRPIQLRNHPFIPADVLDDVENHADLALQMRPDLNQARLQVQRGDLEIVRTRNGLLPRMDLFVTLGKTGYSSSFGGAISDLKGKGYDAAVGLRFDLPITSRDAEAQFRRAVLTREQSTEAVNNAAQLVQVDVRTAYVEVQRTAQQIVATAATRRLQEVKLTTETEKFRIGKSTSLLVAQAQRDLVASQINEIEAVVSHLKALVELYRLEGSLLERRRIAAPGRDPIGLTNK